MNYQTGSIHYSYLLNTQMIIKLNCCVLALSIQGPQVCPKKYTYSGKLIIGVVNALDLADITLNSNFSRIVGVTTCTVLTEAPKYKVQFEFTIDVVPVKFLSVEILLKKPAYGNLEALYEALNKAIETPAGGKKVFTFGLSTDRTTIS